jgi:hypothetical protein
MRATPFAGPIRTRPGIELWDHRLAEAAAVSARARGSHVNTIIRISQRMAVSLSVTPNTAVT